MFALTLWRLPARLSPLADLLVRAWLAHAMWRTGLTAVADWHGTVVAMHPVDGLFGLTPSVLAGIAVAARFVLPVLLLLGLFTRLAAIPLLGVALGAAAREGIGPAIWAVMFGWYALIGPGLISLDRLLGQGANDSALPFARPVGGALAWLRGTLRPVLRTALRAAAVGVLVQMGAMTMHPAALCATLLVVGAATPFAALALIALVADPTMRGMSDPLFSWTALCLLIAAEGAGPLSLDAVIEEQLSRRARRRTPAETLPQVVVVGGGFGGLAAARALARAPCQVTVVDRANHTLFQPLLYQVATAALSPADIAVPVREVLRGQANASVRMGEVTRIDRAAKHVITADGQSLPYDYLILATGARHGYFGNDAWEAHAPGLKTVEDATELRRRILLAFERAEAAEDPADRAALMTFAIIGGGPTGVELAGAIAELAGHALAGEFRRIDPRAARVILFHLGDRLLPTFPPPLSAHAAEALTRLGVDVRLNAGVEAVSATGVVSGGTEIPCRTAFWAAGVMASPAGKWLGVDTDRSGRVPVGPDLTVAGAPDIFVIGDTAASNGWAGKPVPGLAPAAKQMGEYAARAVAARLTGAPATKPFAYKHAGSLATIGRREAVAELGRLHLSGATAWWFWGAVHLLFLANARSRFAVFVQWAWAYLTLNRGIRLITAPPR